MISPSYRFLVLKRCNFRCVYCGRSKADGIRLEVDHARSRYEGGSDDPDNLVAACDECNQGKGPVSVTPIPPADALERVKTAIHDLGGVRLTGDRDNSLHPLGRKHGQTE